MIMKKILGLLLVIAGILIILTPFTPGSILLIIGLEMLLGHKIKWWTEMRKKIKEFARRTIKKLK